MADLNDLKRRASIIKNATIKFENTAQRIGSLFLDIVTAVENAVFPATKVQNGYMTREHVKSLEKAHTSNNCINITHYSNYCPSSLQEAVTYLVNNATAFGVHLHIGMHMTYRDYTTGEWREYVCRGSDSDWRDQHFELANNWHAAIVDNLNTDTHWQALSAGKGKTLNESITTLGGKVDDVESSLGAITQNLSNLGSKVRDNSSAITQQGQTITQQGQTITQQGQTINNIEGSVENNSTAIAHLNDITTKTLAVNMTEAEMDLQIYGIDNIVNVYLNSDDPLPVGFATILPTTNIGETLQTLFVSTHMVDDDNHIIASPSNKVRMYTRTVKGYAESGSLPVATSWKEVKGVGEINNGGEIFNLAKAATMASHAEGALTSALGIASHAEGNKTTTLGASAHIEGGSDVTAESKEITSETDDYTIITRWGSDIGTTGKAFSLAKGDHSHVEGHDCIAFGSASHVGGKLALALGDYSFAHGVFCMANIERTFAGGAMSTAGCWQGASGEIVITLPCADPTSNGWIAQGQYALAFGENCNANGRCSATLGISNHAMQPAQVVIGINNEATPFSNAEELTNTAFIIGNGTTTKGNAFKVLFNGQTHADGAYSSGGADYAEMFEWSDGNPSAEDRVGMLVSLDGEKIVKANGSDILGIISANPAILGDNPMRWHNKFMTDEWGRPIVETMEVKRKKVVDNEVVEVSEMVEGYKVNPDYNPGTEYTDRKNRPEWSAVGFMGKLLVRQDGTLKVGGHCSAKDGIATHATKGNIRVLRVINENQALVLIK